jgi:O-methyltransferase involved in polyketide biosynthesis
LVVYLPDEAQEALFDNISALSAPGSRLAFEFVPDTAIFTDPRWRAHHDRMSELGFEVDFNDLVYHGQRSHLVDHLKQRGWEVSSQTVKELHAANGFHYPDDDVAEAFADVTYSSAVLTH